MTGENKDRESGPRPAIQLAFTDARPVPSSGDGPLLSAWRSTGAPLSSDPVMAAEQARFLGNMAIAALMGDEVAARLLYGHFAGVHAGNVRDEKSQREKAEEFHAWMVRLAIQQQLREIDGLIDRYNQMADWHHEQAKKAREKMQAATDRLTAIGEFVDGVDEVLAEKERTGNFDREKAIRLLKSRGVEVDPNEDDEALLNRVRREKGKALDERLKWSTQYDDAKADDEYNTRMEKENREKAEELVKRRDDLRRQIENGDLGEDAGKQRLDQVTDEYKIDVQKKAAEIEGRRHGLGQANETDAAARKSFDASTSTQTQSQVSDFEALAGALNSPPPPKAPGA